MQDRSFQATIVGKDAIPKYPRKSKWNFLGSMLEFELNPGQAIRIVLPKDHSIYGVKMAWSKLAKAKGVYGHTRTIKQVDGSKILYLWYDK